jgi:hypothetical protein
MTKAEKKAARRRRSERIRKRAYRARQREQNDGSEPFKFVEPAPSVILPQSQPKPAALDVTAIIARVKAELAAPAALPERSAPPASPAADMPSTLPTVPRMDTFLFNTSQDKFRPSWYSDVDPQGAVIRLGFSPRAVRKSPPIATSGTVQIAHDPGIIFSEAAGHVDIAQREADEATEAERSKGDHTAWR